jgi:hypothetical protein
MPLSHDLSFADRGFYEDWVTSLFNVFCQILTWASHSGIRRPGMNSPASGTSPCITSCCDTCTPPPSPHISFHAPALCSSPFSSLLPRTSSSWPWLPKRSGGLDPFPTPYPYFMTTGHCRMYLFILQLIQIPLIAVGRTSVIKRNRLLGNSIFWLGLYAGLPLLCLAYVLY